MARKVGRKKLRQQALALVKRLERFDQLLSEIPECELLIPGRGLREAQDLRLDIKDLIEDLRCNPQVPHVFWPPPVPTKPRRRTRRPAGKAKGDKRA